MFDINLCSDERDLPFELCGAVDSTWRIELPQEHNQFDLETVSDAVVHISYTARDGGEVLKKAASESISGLLPDNGLRYFEARINFSDVWYRCFAPRELENNHRDRRLPQPQQQQHPRPGHENGYFQRQSRRRHHQLAPHHSHSQSRNRWLLKDYKEFPMRFSAQMFPFISLTRCVRASARLHITGIDLFIEACPIATPPDDCCGCGCGGPSGRDIDLCVLPASCCARHAHVPTFVQFKLGDGVYRCRIHVMGKAGEENEHERNAEHEPPSHSKACKVRRV
ncbi:hypothetical protein B0O99DRAFT_694118 [Bisporella sp. PMI_857]|nr:hypothetical protein B0O99DRAFT_694118 [Bisporella sp. PMI_857]